MVDTKGERTKYIRLLERFLYSIVHTLLKSEAISKEQFVKKVANSRKYLDKVEPVKLYSEDLMMLQKAVDRIFELASADDSMEDIRNEILRLANQLEKQKAKKKHKKDKHQKSAFEEWE